MNLIISGVFGGEIITGETKGDMPNELTNKQEKTRQTVDCSKRRIIICCNHQKNIIVGWADWQQAFEWGNI